MRIPCIMLSVFILTAMSINLLKDIVNNKQLEGGPVSWNMLIGCITMFVIIWALGYFSGRDE